MGADVPGPLNVLLVRERPTQVEATDISALSDYPAPLRPGNTASRVAVLLTSAAPALCRPGWVVAALGRTHDTTYDHAGSGVWVSLAGFAAVALSGVLIALSGRRAPAAAPPWSPPGPASHTG